MRTPKAPPGFVPVDSEEAKGIDENTIANYCYIYQNTWRFGNAVILYMRLKSHDYPEAHYHVQLPPPVEWEEVWGIGKNSVNSEVLTKNGRLICPLHMLTPQQQMTIVRALNEMEGRMSDRLPRYYGDVSGNVMDAEDDVILDAKEIAKRLNDYDEARRILALIIFDHQEGDSVQERIEEAIDFFETRPHKESWLKGGEDGQ